MAGTFLYFKQTIKELTQRRTRPKADSGSSTWSMSSVRTGECLLEPFSVFGLFFLGPYGQTASAAEGSVASTALFALGNVQGAPIGRSLARPQQMDTNVNKYARSQLSDK